MDATLHELHQFPNPNLPILFPTHARSGCGPQWHKNIELLYCTSGKGTLICAGIEHSMESGCIYVINPNELHTVFNRGELLYYCLIVDDDFLAQSGVHTEHAEIDIEVRDEQANRIFDEIVRQMEDPEPYYETCIQGLVLLLIVRLLRQCGKSIREHSPRLRDPDAPIKQAIDYIKANYARKLTLEEISNEVGFSKHYLARRFKKSIGMTVIEYINQVRCKKAKKLLKQKKLSILQIANQCGFDNASYFSKTFRAVMGQLPSEYREDE